jgi:hypothetical protein
MIVNQLEAWLIMLRSIAEPSLPLSVNGPTKLTHNVSHEVLIKILDGKVLIYVSIF